MLCSKIGSDCPHPVGQDDKFVFVMMPFRGFDNIYDAIQMAVKGIEGKGFECMRADEKYTTFAIWCQNICKNIRKAKYLIVDTTGRNPNVFYELGFTHALENTKVILITQEVKDAPFDISDLNHIEYSTHNLRDLREKLQKAILELEKEEAVEGYENKTSDEMIAELKSQLRKEEERASKFKKELHESEDRERDLKLRIKEVEAIKDNPVEEAKSQITKLEGTIAELKSKLKFTEDDKKDKITQLSETLKEKEAKLKILVEEFDSYKNSKDEKPLSTLLFDDTKKSTEAEKWFNEAYSESKQLNYSKAIEYYSNSIELNPEDASAFNNRGNAYASIGNHDKAIDDYNKAIDLNPEYSYAFNNRGFAFYALKKYEKAAEDLSMSIYLNPYYTISYIGRGNAFREIGKYDEALSDYNRAIELNSTDNLGYKARGLYYKKLKDYKSSINDFEKAIQLDPNDVEPYINLAELEIITGNYQGVSKNTEKVFELSIDLEHRSICFYFEFIAMKMLDMDIPLDREKKFATIMKSKFEITWPIEYLESWMENENISMDKKRFFIKKIKMLKKKMGSML